MYPWEYMYPRLGTLAIDLLVLLFTKYECA